MSLIQKKEPNQLKINDVFRLNRLLTSWTKTVRAGMRQQYIVDLSDYMDFHMNRHKRLERVSADIVAGVYTPQQPMLVRLEKRCGICRHISIPVPEDAVVLQCLVDHLETAIKQAQPSRKAFYSRSHSHMSVERALDHFDYPWFIQWPQFQKELWGFASTHPYVVMTDVQNYFDSIPLTQLRNTISTLGSFEAELLDFLIFMLEHFTWRLGYAPSVQVGLPVLNFDAPRLLAHAFLFGADRFLEQATGGQFVRWMDDIDFAVSSPDDGRAILRDLDDRLHKIGVRLNPSKTRIITGEKALDDLCADENVTLNVIQNSLQTGVLQGTTAVKTLALEYRRFRQRRDRPASGKVLKRYFTMATKLRSRFLQRNVASLLRLSPEHRDSCFRYYSTLGYSPARFRDISEYISTGQCIDDVSWFGAASVLVAWDLPGRSSAEAVELALHVCGDSCPRTVAALWILAKYGSAGQILQAINSSRALWRNSDFLSRQVGAVSVRLPFEARTDLERELANAGCRGAISVTQMMVQFRETKRLDSWIVDYLLKSNLQPTGARLPRFLLTLALLSADLPPADRDRLRDKARDRFKHRAERRILEDA